MSKQKIEAVIVTYNRKEMLAKCLDAVLGQSLVPDKVIVVDNHSTDGTKAYLQQAGYLDRAEVTLLELSENSGGAGGFYEGMKVARADGADWIWIMDDDVIPKEACLEALVTAGGNVCEAGEKVSFLASSVRGKNGEAMNVPKLNRKQFTKYTDWYRHLDEGMVEIVKATFVSLLINGQAVQKCGLPWKPFFIWGDDSEYTQRLIRDFGPAYMVGKSEAIHMRERSDELSLVAEKNKKRIPMYFYYYRNNLIGFWEYETALYRFLCLGKLGYDFVRVLLFGKYKFQKMGVILKAFFHFAFGLYDKKSFRNRANL